MSLEDYTQWFGLAALLSVAGAVAQAYRWRIAQDTRINDGLKEQNEKLERNNKEHLEKVATLQVTINTMETWVNIWRGIMEKELPKILIKPHRPEIDYYLRRMRDEGLDGFTPEEAMDFVTKMQKVVAGQVPDAYLDDDSLKLGYTLVIGNVVSHLELRKLRDSIQSKEKETKEAEAETKAEAQHDRFHQEHEQRRQEQQESRHHYSKWWRR